MQEIEIAISLSLNSSLRIGIFSLFILGALASNGQQFYLGNAGAGVMSCKKIELELTNYSSDTLWVPFACKRLIYSVGDYTFLNGDTIVFYKTDTVPSSPISNDTNAVRFSVEPRLFKCAFPPNSTITLYLFPNKLSDLRKANYVKLIYHDAYVVSRLRKPIWMKRKYLKGV